MDESFRISDFVDSAPTFLAGLAPWQATTNAIHLVELAIAAADAEFSLSDIGAIHKSAVVEAGAIVKGPVFIGPRCYIASGAYLRGGVWLEGDDIVGPHCELKTTFMFKNSKTAHLNFVGDSILGQDVNVEAGAMIANYRNEKPDKRICFRFRGAVVQTGVDKFGAMVGDHARVGANAVIAPGAIIERGEIVRRLQLVDQA